MATSAAGFAAASFRGGAASTATARSAASTAADLRVASKATETSGTRVGPVSDRADEGEATRDDGDRGSRWPELGENVW
ncbi:MAG: hypothetical protein KAI47_11460, partial [Deltaproteobacteria bacterium]|nr:hypothetical protein [Deltaproteobacteria bacterium]